ncbi:3-keto-disaccharide hydrolase [Candidatus Halobonum tyrrellensis]|uniref:3-keto-alpha-glucoside-1,2-lyase/3-keto-2-hydroxy-glucal hydratase domain-containing protein n=1 Tax=Candidatus Halobonum tyrrellensis G22 TaxID=1324957 RepID=V4HPH9_9EURY|nr:DUF1080 domain-containing protein [Candidatus Halobonum tyrrellensis]ESP89799.1 hypothetical protein K933_02411 [Candidatus Halobonum tyrrellensis G22]
MSDRQRADDGRTGSRTRSLNRRGVLAGLGTLGLGAAFAGSGRATPGRADPEGGAVSAEVADESEFVSLFDGGSLADSYWHQVNGQANYSAEDGVIVGSSVPESPNSFLTHYKVFDDFEVRMEVHLDQAMNSGVQVRSNLSREKPEVHGPQVEIELSGEGTQQFPPAESGYVYGESLDTGWLSQERPPTDAFDNDGWNDYRIRVEGDTIRTWINGREIETLDLGQYADVPHLVPMGVLGLQVHAIDAEGYTVRWRNVRINELDADEWTPLFDGRGTEGWTGLAGEGDVGVSDDVLELRGGESFSLRTEERYDDFVFETWVDADAEGGVLFRNPGEGRVDGYRVDVDPTDGMTGSLSDAASGEYLKDTSGEAVSEMAFHPDQWNYLRVLANGETLRVWVNGVTTAWLTDGAHSSGYLGLQHLGGDGALRFRELSVNPLAGDESPVGPPPAVLPYQVDLVAGEPNEVLGESEDDFYGRQGRLIQYAHGNADGVTTRDTWINSLDAGTRGCVDADPIQVDDRTASVSVTVADGCEPTLSLVSYTLPGGAFSFETADDQELVDDESETFGPGDHTLEVELPVGRPEE